MLPCLARHYKVRIKGKVDHLGVVAIERGAFGGSPSTMVANFTIQLRAGWEGSCLFQGN